MTKNLITQMNKKKIAPLRAKNDVTHAIQLKLHEQKVAVTSYGRNKNHDDGITKERANSPSYRCAAIKNKTVMKSKS